MRASAITWSSTGRWTPIDRSASWSMLVSTVTPIISGTGRPSFAEVSRAARAAACIMALPPDAWTLIIQAPVPTAVSTACSTVFGIS